MPRPARALAVILTVAASALLLTASASVPGLSGTPNAPSPSPSTALSPLTEQTPDSTAPPTGASSDIVNVFSDSGLTIMNISDLGHICGDADGQLDCRSAALTDEVMVIEWNDLAERATFMDPTITAFAGDFSLSINPEVVPAELNDTYNAIFELAVAGS